MSQPYGRSACRSNRRGMTLAAAALMPALLVAIVTPVRAQGDPPLPRLGEDKHLGVATCAGSTCHGAGEPVAGSNVMQNEFLIWHRRDPHSKAYSVLRSDRSQRIAERLGLGPATEADTCLDCHADNVPEERRGRRFQLSDGVGCEACHGGAEGWIRSHTSDEVSHADNVANGLYPTDRPVERTRLCLSCHYSHPESPMTHRIMAAGHPSLLFETDTFSLIRPSHHRVDADYRRRKTAATPAETWAIGQAVAARTRVRQVRDDVARGGLFPELYYFDCQSCHHALGDDTWVSRPIVAQPPGTVRFADATFRMLGYVLAEVEPELAPEWMEALKGLHRSQGQGVAAVERAAEELLAVARRAQQRLAGTDLGPEAVKGIARRIAADGAARGYADRGWADQAAMALAALVDSLSGRGALEGEARQRAEAELDKLFEALASPYGHAPQKVRASMKAIEPAF